MPTIRTRQEPWRDLEVSDAEATSLGRQGLILPEDEYPEATQEQQVDAEAPARPAADDPEAGGPEAKEPEAKSSNSRAAKAAPQATPAGSEG